MLVETPSTCRDDLIGAGGEEVEVEMEARPELSVGHRGGNEAGDEEVLFHPRHCPRPPVPDLGPCVSCGNPGVIGCAGCLEIFCGDCYGTCLDCRVGYCLLTCMASHLPCNLRSSDMCAPLDANVDADLLSHDHGSEEIFFTQSLHVEGLDERLAMFDETILPTPSLLLSLIHI